MFKMFDYIAHGGDKIAELEASLEHMGRYLGFEIDENKKLRELLKRCVLSLAGYRREMDEHQPCDAERDAREYLGI